MALQNSGARLQYDFESSSYLPRDIERTRRKLPAGYFLTSSGSKYPSWARRILGDAAFGSVVRVDLNGAGIRDADLVHLAGLPKLKELDLGGTKITGAGFVYLQDTQLQSLVLAGTAVSDASLANLTRCSSLQHLDLQATNVTSRGLIHIRGMIQLGHLSLAGTSVGDQGLGQLAALVHLNYLNLENTNVSRAGLWSLCNDLPSGCVIANSLAQSPLVMGNSAFGSSVAIGGTFALVADGGAQVAQLFDIATREMRFVLWPDSNGGSTPDFARSVATDGKLAIVGAPSDNPNGQRGAAYVFDTTTGEQLQKLAQAGFREGDGFGHSIAMEGSTAVISGYFGVYVFDLKTGEQRRELKDSFGSVSGCRAVALDGNLAVAGVSGSRQYGGRAYVFDVRTGELLQTLRPLIGTPSERHGFGACVAIDGDNVAIGEWPSQPGTRQSGAVDVFDAKTGKLLVEFTSDDRDSIDLFGCSVDLSANTLVVGAEHDGSFEPNSGAAYVYDLTTGQCLAKLVGQEKDAEFGHAVAIQGDQILVGAWGAESADRVPQIFSVSDLRR